jgi:hypothetical protein
MLYLLICRKAAVGGEGPSRRQENQTTRRAGRVWRLAPGAGQFAKREPICAPNRQGDDMPEVRPMIVLTLRIDTETQDRRRRLEKLYETKLPALMEKIFRNFEKHVLAVLDDEQRARYFAKQLPKLEYREIAERRREAAQAAE